jgi:hypothetical protein
MTRRGSPFQCFRRGIAIGRYITEKTIPERVRQRTRQIEATTSAVTRRQLARQIQEEGIAVLKREIQIGNLNKDLIRSIAIRLTGTNQAIPRYSSMSREQLVDELVQRGFQR